MARLFLAFFLGLAACAHAAAQAPGDDYRAMIGKQVFGVSTGGQFRIEATVRASALEIRRFTWAGSGRPLELVCGTASTGLLALDEKGDFSGSCEVPGMYAVTVVHGRFPSMEIRGPETVLLLDATQRGAYEDATRKEPGLSTRGWALRRATEELFAAERVKATADTAPAAPVPVSAPAPAPAPAPDGELARLRAEIESMKQHVATLREPAPAAAARRMKAQALVIGNGNYKFFGKLANPRNDATAIADKLRGMGIPVETVLDADRDGIVRVLSQYAARAADTELNILYYAGHGVQVDGVNYIIPTNMQAEGISAGAIKLSGISLNAVLDYLPASTRLVFLDACRDNPASRTLARTRGGVAGLAPVSTVSGTLIAYATRDGATAEDGQGRHSPYAEALLKHLDAPQDIGIVLRQVRQSVMTATANRQEPWEYGSLVGDALVLSRVARP